MSEKTVDLNADLGEGFGPWRLGDDAALAPLITRGNVACGFHAGDPSTMAATVRLLKAHGVAVGAHPGYPDRVGFGRRALAATPEEIAGDVAYQVGALAAFCRLEGVRLTHVKLHGALYHRAAGDEAVARAVARVVRALSPELALLGPPGSRLEAAAGEVGIPFLAEGFVDRGYGPDGQLLPRGTPGALLSPTAAVRQALRLWLEGGVDTPAGPRALAVDTLSVHGDNPAVVETLTLVAAEFTARGIWPARPC
jgi:UPF0271 protein